jgi:hypothetical protein
MANRILLGKGSATRGSSDYGLWISKSGQNVTSCTEANLLYNWSVDSGSPGLEHYYGRSGIIAESGSISRQTSTSPTASFHSNATKYFPVILGPSGVRSYPLVLYGFVSNNGVEHQQGFYSVTSTWNMGGDVEITRQGYGDSTGSPWSSGQRYFMCKFITYANRGVDYVIFEDGAEV